MKRNVIKKPIIFYHGKCLDGFTGAWAAWKKFGKEAEYKPLLHESYGTPSGCAGRDVYFIDFCLPEEIMRELKSEVRSMTILDHHVSHKDALHIADHAVYGTDTSGCVLAWNYFHPKKKVPRLLNTIQDNDLFTLKIPNTLEICAALMMVDFDFHIWDTLVASFEQARNRKNFASRGSLLLNYKERYVTRLLEIAEPVLFEGHKAYAVNTHIFYSEVGARIYQTLPVHLGIAWHYVDGRIKVSLRSDGMVNTATIAKKYGGGGHTGASGFWIDHLEKFPWKKR